MTTVFDFEPEIIEAAKIAADECRAGFHELEKTAEICSKRVLSAFISNRVSEACLYGSTGYGYGDIGRDTADRVFADIFEAEDALVRHTLVSGTHALATALCGVLRSGDLLVSVTGKPYDTLEEVIGIRAKKGNGSLADSGVRYSQLDLLPDGQPDYDNIPNAVADAKMVYLQRSRGYSLRPAISIAQMQKLFSLVKKVNPQAIIMVDNCYGEFVEEHEPVWAGADLIAGSLIKNPGGGIARTGGYIAGKSELVSLCADRLTCVGMGREVGCTLGETRNILLGIFLAPEIVMNALKTSLFAEELFTGLGFECLPARGEKRSDIITAILLKNPELLCAFCRGIQKGSPVDSFVTPEPWDMPGYDSKVIMAAGAFTMGASIELSADAPLREPFAVWMQGGLTFSSAKLGVMCAADEVMRALHGKC